MTAEARQPRGRSRAAAQVDGAVFIRRAPGGQCQRCSRELGDAYLLDVPGHGEVVMGRRCAARTLGWATTRVEMAAVAAERTAELARRRQVLAAAGLLVHGDVDPFTGLTVFEDGVDEDWCWRQGDQIALDRAHEAWAWRAHWALDA